MFFRFNKFTLIWAIVIFIVTMISGVKGSNIKINSFDKITHLTVFMILSLLMVVGLTKQKTFKKLQLYAEKSTIIISFTYGFLIEFIQYLLPYRTFSWLDVLANTCGVFMGMGLFYIIYKFRVT